MADENEAKPAIGDLLKTKAAAAGKPDTANVVEPGAVDEGSLDFDLTTIDDEEVRTGLKAVLDRAKSVQKAARELATYGIVQAIHARALELAQELNVPEQVADIEALLKGTTTPKELDIRAREVRLDLLNESVPGKKADDAESQGGEPGKGQGKQRVFDEGRGRGTNPSAELMKKIDDIDPSDPEADKKLNEVYRDVMQAQERFAKRQR